MNTIFFFILISVLININLNAQTDKLRNSSPIIEDKDSMTFGKIKPLSTPQIYPLKAVNKVDTIGVISTQTFIKHMNQNTRFFKFYVAFHGEMNRSEVHTLGSFDRVNFQVSR